MELSAAGDWKEALLAAYREPVLRRALRVKSGSLYAALMRHERGAARLSEESLFSLYRYFARVTTRCTPLMMFAGVGEVQLGEFTQARMAGEADWRLGVFPSWSSILRLTRAMLDSEEIRHAARYRINETIVPRGGVLCYYTEQEPEGSKILTPRYKVVSLRRDPQLQPLLREPARLWMWEELVGVILAAQPGATRELAEQYLFSMLDGGVLLSSLQPPSIGARPERYLHDTAMRDFALSEYAAQSRDLLELTDQPLPVADARFDAAWEALVRHPWAGDQNPDGEASSAALRRGTTCQTVLRIDAASGGISQALVGQLGELIGRTRGLWSHNFAIYRHAIALHFAAGTVGQRIALLELTYRIAKGPGIEEMLAAAAPGRLAQAVAAPPLARYLAGKLLDADLAQEEQIELDVDELNQAIKPAAESCLPNPPPFAEAMVRCIHLHGRAALVHYGTSSHVGALLNRFLHWNAADPLLRQLQTIWQTEEQLAQPAIVAEITCGGGGRLRELSQRPLTYAHQIVVNGQPSVSPQYQIPLHELSVVMSQQGPILWWERKSVSVRARQLSALHFQAFSPVVQVLLALSPQPADWGLYLEHADLPVRTARLCYRDIVLRPQSFLLLPSLQKLLRQPEKERREAELWELLRMWRARYQVPRLVRLGDAERNAVDLDNPLCIGELADLVKADKQRVFEEYCDAGSPVVGEDGPLVAEAVVHLRLHAPPAIEPPSAAGLAAPSPVTAALLETIESRQAQVFYPGSSWLFLKLYYGGGLGSHAETRQFIDDDLLGRFVAPLITELEKAGRLAGFHFVRYADPEAHLRLRLQPKEGTALALLEQIRERLDAQARAGAFARWEVATYERETDRYGGPELITNAERFFTSDSRLCLRMLAAYHKDSIEQETDLQMLLPIRTLNTLYRAFDFDLAARLDCLSKLRRAYEQSHPPSAEEKSARDAKYRRHSRAIQRLLFAMEGSDAGGEAPYSRRKDIPAWFRVYEQSVREIAAMYHAAQRSGTISRPITEILPSLFHMHCNRLLGGIELEHEVIYLCQRGVQAISARLKKTAAPGTKTGPAAGSEGSS